MIDFDLSQLTENEIKTIAKETSTATLIGPIIRDRRRYAAEARRLGDMDVKKEIVKLMARNLSVSLYRRSNPDYIKIFHDSVNDINEWLIDCLVEVTGDDEFTPSKLKECSPEEIAGIISTQCEMDNKTIDDFNWDLFWLQLKINDIIFDDEKKKEIKSILGLEDEEDSEEPTDLENLADAPIEPESKGKKKPKKKTPQEKAASYQAAMKKKKELEALQKSMAEPAVVEVESPKKEKIAETRIEPTYTVHQRRDNMGTYIGKVNIIGTHYNFTPLYEKTSSGGWFALREDEIDTLLDGAERQNIEFVHNSNDNLQHDFVTKRFKENQLVVFDFEKDDLEDNVDPYGNLKQTAYKVQCYERYMKDKIRYLVDEDFYTVISIDDLDDDIASRDAVRLNTSEIAENEYVLVDTGDGFFAGPYPVKFVSNYNSYFIVPNSIKNKYILYGYEESALKKQKFRDSEYRWSSGTTWEVVSIKPDALETCKDVIPDDILLKSFNDSFGDHNLSSHGETANAINAFENSVLSGDKITPEIRESRSARLTELLNSVEESKDIADDKLDIICNLIANHANDERAQAIIDAIVEKRPDFLNKIPGIKAIDERVARGQQKLQEIENDTSEALEKQKKAQVSQDVDSIISERSTELEELTAKLKLAKDIDSLTQSLNKTKEEVTYYESHKSHLSSETKNLESQFVDLVNNYSDKIANLAFDGFMSSKMLQAASNWESKEDKNNFNIIANSVTNIETDFASHDELIEYLLKTIQIERPQYDKNTIINILICLSQGFLTVFSGAPGSGKTSICNIVAKALGLMEFNNILNPSDLIGSTNRFVPVSVERGWTSKRDFIGYFNPLTKSFEENNREIFDGLKLLDYEAKNNSSKFPYFILLDEANLSPMEYYWADFMNVCDESGIQHSINLGNNNIFTIPDSLHFMATINNDNTTEDLSPRLIDRAWIVSLPKGTSVGGRAIVSEDVRIVPWALMKETFAGKGDPYVWKDTEASEIFALIRQHLTMQEYDISPRSEVAIKRYCNVASSLMEEDGVNSPSTIALDYAIAQKVLPKLTGSNEEYSEWLGKFRDLCTENGLYQSSRLIESIIYYGQKKNMGFYKFF